MNHIFSRARQVHVAEKPLDAKRTTDPSSIRPTAIGVSLYHNVLCYVALLEREERSGQEGWFGAMTGVYQARRDTIRTLVICACWCYHNNCINRSPAVILAMGFSTETKPFLHPRLATNMTDPPRTPLLRPGYSTQTLLHSSCTKITGLRHWGTLRGNEPLK